TRSMVSTGAAVATVEICCCAAASVTGTTTVRRLATASGLKGFIEQDPAKRTRRPRRSAPVVRNCIAINGKVCPAVHRRQRSLRRRSGFRGVLGARGLGLGALPTRHVAPDVAALGDAGGLTRAAAQVIEFGAAHITAAH